MRLECPNCHADFVLDENQSAKLLAQVRDAAFERQVANAVREKTAALESDFGNRLALAVERQRSDDIQAAAAERERLSGEIAQLRAEVKGFETVKALAVREAVDALQVKHDETERALRTEMEYYRDLKARMSTKMIGETLEQHCSAEFERIRAFLPAGVYFEKDNDARTGSKGDFIYRESQGGVDVLSVMFEMKNEADGTERKHRNEDFFRELDKDRREKKCEYAVLVSLLEADSEVYNNGIVDVSHRYPKMYVIRPQFFIPLLTILRSAALSAMEARTELAAVRDQNIDVARFEADIAKFREGFDYNIEQAGKRLTETLDEIDKAIARLQKARDGISAAERQIRLAGSKSDSLTVQKLVRGNPTMEKLFAEGK